MTWTWYWLGGYTTQIRKTSGGATFSDLVKAMDTEVVGAAPKRSLSLKGKLPGDRHETIYVSFDSKPRSSEGAEAKEFLA